MIFTPIIIQLYTFMLQKYFGFDYSHTFYLNNYICLLLFIGNVLIKKNAKRFRSPVLRQYEFLFNIFILDSIFLILVLVHFSLWLFHIIILSKPFSMINYKSLPVSCYWIIAIFIHTGMFHSKKFSEMLSGCASSASPPSPPSSPSLLSSNVSSRPAALHHWESSRLCWWASPAREDDHYLPSTL